MAIIIGSKYIETKNKLINKLMNGYLNYLEDDAIFHVCYFCKKSINGKMKILIDVESNSIKEVYFLDNVCFLSYINRKN
ncbi:MAG: hypothetical protein QXD48_00675 [Candidatus Aenigmatarchaeota archaeon]